MSFVRKLLLVSALVVPASGCVLVEKHTRGHSASAGCHPSQYWDGSTCRHKGKGQGARKHDGAGKHGSGKKNAHKR